MKRLNLVVLMLASAVMLCFTSCLNEATDPNSGEGQLPANVATLSEQVAAMKSSVAAIEALSADFSETDGLEEAAAQLEYCATLVKEHIASVEAGMSGVNAAIAAMKLQKEIANVTGALKVEVALFENEEKIQSDILEVETRVAAWLGKYFKNYFEVSAEQARLSSMLSLVKSQSISADAISSDVEAGLRVGDATGLNEVVATVAKNSETLSELSASMTALASEVEQGYTSAINSNSSKSALKALNTKATTALANSTPTINELDARIKVCEEAIADLNTRLEKVETDINALLGMIQSLTFVSEYSDDKAVAYYSMTSELNPERAGEGKKDRVPAETFNLTFLVRPAAVADALAQTWQESLSVIGYYANAIQTRATSNIQEFNIVDAVSTTGKGLLTVTVNNAFDDDFYFKEKGAKLALAVESGKNNCASKFIEIVPRDITGKVYAESLELTPTTLSIQNGDSYKLVAKVTPSNVTDQGFIWEDYNSEYVSIDANGTLTATAVGKSQIRVSANATDEFGRELSAMCDVDVTPAIRIVGSGYVEVGKSITLDIESPNYIDPQYVKWNLEWAGNSGYLGLEKNDDGSCTLTGYSICFQPPAGSPSGSKSVYQPINVVCTIEGAKEPVVLTTGVMVVALQPKAIAVNGLAHDDNKLSLKRGETFQCVSTVQPDDVNMDWFNIIYQSNQTAVASVDFRSGLITANAFGTTTIDIKLSDKTSESYFYPNREGGWARTLAVTVEPYWVKSMTLPETYKMAPNAVATLTPDWISDVEGVAPSDQTLTWTSSDPSVIEINPTTGQMTALKEGTSTITATTSGSNSVPSGSEHKTSSCFVTVEIPTVPVNVGDFYYSDGTWSTTRDNSKTIIGIIFSKVDATAADGMLRANYPECSHGLVMSISEYNESFGYIQARGGANYPLAGEWLYKAGYKVYDTSIANGYSNTIGWNAYGESKGDALVYDVKYAALFRENTGISDVHANNVPSPLKASSWYVPSYYEMNEIYQNRDLINTRLRSISKTEISAVGYWMSSFKSEDKYNDGYLRYFDMSTGGWGDMLNYSGAYSEKRPVRVVLAF